MKLTGAFVKLVNFINTLFLLFDQPVETAKLLFQ